MRQHDEHLITAEPRDERIVVDELTNLLHVSLPSDAFGFDLIGWLSPDPESSPQAMLLEVKSSASASS